jgi:3-hydroxy-9,10-secoandrosta-1,3,5(10)-triene-9,17-dione monooxygenase
MPLGEAVVAVDSAALLLHRDVDDLTRRCAAGERLSQAQRARYLLDGAFVVASCTRAVDRLFAVSGAGVLFDASPLQRAFRDLHALSAHAALQLEAATERFGRIELGLPTESPLLLI